ncbi:MAG: NUDIX hydrolase, partial [Chloroflexi bacterium]|nr:NUDIX hydrolase [Chloroflexota bacterium]
ITPDGKPGVYNIIESPTSVWIVPVTADGQIVLIHTYRYTIDQYSWEVPAGAQEPGQTVKEAALAELREEVGGSTKALQQIGRFYTAPGISDEDGFYFLATGVTLGQPDHESTEIMEIHTKPIAEALQMVQEGVIVDGNSAFALMMAAPYLQKFMKDT